MVKDVAETLVYCPLFDNNVSDCLCYEIGAAMREDLKKSAVPEIKDWEKVSETCPKCNNYIFRCAEK